jgi:hypothetical protein
MKHIFFLLTAIIFFHGSLSAQWVQTYGPYGGGVNCFAVDDTTLYAGTDGGVFRSTNYGASWTQISSGLEGLKITSLAVAPNGTGGRILFAGGMDNSTLGGAIFRSNDNGVSWTKVFVDSLDRAHFGINVPALLVRTSQTSETSIFAGIYYGGGIFCSKDYGSSWNNVLRSGATTAFASNDTDIFAIASGVLRSTDGGTIWVEKDTGITRSSGFSNASITAIMINGTNIFVGMSNWNLEYPLCRLYRSTDHGNSWSQRDSGITAPTVSSFAVSGSNIFAGTDSSIYLSTDNGVSWSVRNSGLGNTKIGPLAVIGTRVFAGTSHGVVLSTNAGSSWTPVAGLLSLSVSALSSNGTGLFAGTYRGVYTSTDNGNNWNPKNSGWQDYSINALVSSGSNIFTGTNKGVFVSTDNGTSWGERDTGIVTSPINALAINGSNLFAAGGLSVTTIFQNRRYVNIYNPGMYISSNNGMSWTMIDSGLAGRQNQVTSLSVDLSSGGSGILYATTILPYDLSPDSSSGIYRSTNNGTTWTHLSTLAQPLNTVRTLGIVSNGIGGSNLIAPYFAWLHVVYGDCVYGANISTDGGSTWNAITISPEISIVHCFTAKGGNIFAATNSGIFVSSDGGWNWSAVNAGLTNLNVESILIKDGYLYAGTSDGVWQRPLSEMTSVETISSNLPMHFNLEQNYPNPFNPVTTIHYSIPKAASVKLQIFDILGRDVATLVNEKKEAGSYDVKFDASRLTSGVYFYRLEAGGFVETKKLVLIK